MPAPWSERCPGAARRSACLLVAVLTLIGAPVAAQAPLVIEVGKFSAVAPGSALPPGWEPLVFPDRPKHTGYELVQDGAAVVVKATSQAGASGLIRRMQIDPKAYPIVQWRWKVGNVLRQGDVAKKSGDDYAARLYITFEYDPRRASFAQAAKYRAAKALFGPDIPFRALNYIWESKAPKGSIVPNPYTDWTMMVVVQSGPGEVGKWIVEERNIYQDFMQAFGTEPLKISGVAIMTDTDNTGESATAYYGDIVFKQAPSKQ